MALFNFNGEGLGINRNALRLPSFTPPPASEFGGNVKLQPLQNTATTEGLNLNNGLTPQQVTNRQTEVDIGQGQLDTQGNIADLGSSITGQGEDIFSQRLSTALGTGNDIADATLTDEQRTNISGLAEEAIRSGSSDIDAGTQRGLELLRQELAPARGLRPSDTPIVDRGSRIVNEGQRLQQQLVSTVRGNEFQNLLDTPFRSGDFNLRRGELNLGGSALRGQQLEGLQGTGLDLARFLEQLEQQDFANRLSSSEQTGRFGLGLAQIGANNQKAPGFDPNEPLVNSNVIAAGVQGFFASAPALKEHKAPLNAEQILEKVKQLHVEQWNYIGDNKVHYGPYADQFATLFQGDGITIDTATIIGTLILSVQALAKKLEDLNG